MMSSYSTFLLVWNPQRWSWPEELIEDLLRAVNRSEFETDRWSCGKSKRIKEGDRVFIIRLGENKENLSRGIFASGWVTRGSYEDEHWDEELALSGKTTQYVEFYYDVLLNPIGDSVLPRDVLKNDPRLSRMHWDSQMSGIQIPDEVAGPLEELWAEISGNGMLLFPEEIGDTSELHEGSKKRITVNAYERNARARRKCIHHHGLNCFVCGTNMEEIYGELGRGLIHVHHVKPLSEIGGSYVVDPINDLIPVCPNCHAIIHRREPAYSVAEVKAYLDRNFHG